ncbi:hypothetical protein [Variovorax sp. ZT4R33]|uniref:hypothetical protein n=1 Tax=Variovorax sp. ZT4R33 TaxID=3443743 RepID=UPI003F464FD5
MQFHDAIAAHRSARPFLPAPWRGIADPAHPLDGLVSERAPLEETVRFHGV